MERKEILTKENNFGASVASSHFSQQLKIKGTLTSQIQLRGENSKEPYYYAFVKLKGQNTDLPVIFKVKCLGGNLVEPQLKKGDCVELTGYYSTSDKNVRKSFTCSFYQLVNHDE